jgi:hypothetical protein
MKLAPTQVGANRRNLVILGGLLVVLVVVFFMNSNSGAPPQASVTPAAQATAPVPVRTPAAVRPTPASLTPMPPQRGQGTRREDASIQDFKPTLKLPEGMDVSRIDPSLKLDLMSKLQQLPMEGGERSLFEFGAAPAPKTPTPVVAPVKPQTPPTPVATTPAEPPPPAKPVQAPIPLKFYGYVSETHGPSKRAFFLDGDDIVVAGENDVIHNRYKIIRIGVNSAVVEDTTSKSEQTLPLVEELPG